MIKPSNFLKNEYWYNIYEELLCSYEDFETHDWETNGEWEILRGKFAYHSDNERGHYIQSRSRYFELRNLHLYDTGSLEMWLKSNDNKHTYIYFDDHYNDGWSYSRGYGLNIRPHHNKGSLVLTRWTEQNTTELANVTVHTRIRNKWIKVNIDISYVGFSKEIKIYINDVLYIDVIDDTPLGGGDTYFYLDRVTKLDGVKICGGG